MKSNAVDFHNFIIRSQIEYSAAGRTTAVRCILETSATGERRGFTDIDALLACLREEMIAARNHARPIGEEERENPDYPKAMRIF